MGGMGSRLVQAMLGVVDGVLHVSTLHRTHCGLVPEKVIVAVQSETDLFDALLCPECPIHPTPIDKETI